MWAKEYEKCIICGTREMPHYGKGYCRKCYYRVNENLQISRLEINRRIGRTQRGKRATKTRIKERLPAGVLKDLYLFKRMSFGDISKQYNCSRAYILKLCKSYRIPVRDKSKARYLALKRGKLPLCYHRVNERFFKTWSIEMSYVLGLLYADGHLDKHMFSFSLASKGKNFLEYIRGLLRSDHPILRRKNQELYVLYIGRAKMVKDLLKLGLTPKKSLIIKFPAIPTNYISHFIRGYFDGDGSLYKQKENNIYRAGIVTGSKDFILSIKGELETLAGVSSQKIHKHKTSSAYFLRYQSRKDIESLFKYFYDGYTIINRLYLPRKFRKFQEAINSYKNWTLNQLMSSRYSTKAKIYLNSEKNLKSSKLEAKMDKIQTNDTTEKLIAYWQLYRQFDANMAHLARYAKVSRDTVYRWLNRKVQPKEQKLQLIQEWLSQTNGQLTKNAPKQSGIGHI